MCAVRVWHALLMDPSQLYEPHADERGLRGTQRTEEGRGEKR